MYIFTLSSRRQFWTLKIFQTGLLRLYQAICLIYLISYHYQSSLERVKMAPHLDTAEKPVSSNGTVSNKLTLLRVSGTNIVDGYGNPVILKGAGLAGHLNMENFITGFSGHEYQLRQAMTEVLGQTLADHFFERMIHHWFTEQDAEFFASLGLNCIRLPFNYRHFIDDKQNPRFLKPDGFKYLDRVVEICGKYNLYVILDLHSVPGGQNQDWHCDSGLSRALFWEFELFQEQVINLWVAIAGRYCNNPIIAGYNPLNEPADPNHIGLLNWYDRVEKAIREVDPNHILFVDGNTYAMDFSHFDRVLPNTVYACHDYSRMGFPIPGQPLYAGTDDDKARLKSQFDRKVQFMRDWNVPIWNGEFGPVYPNPKDTDAAITTQARLNMLGEQLRIYADSNVSWSIWLYKDIGYQGMVYVDPETPYMKLIESFVAKKQHLGLDFWGCTNKEGVSDVYDPFVRRLKDMVPKHLQNKKYPPTWKFDRQVERVVRESLMSEYLVWEFAELFKGKDKEELEELAKSFAFENCVKRDKLNAVLIKDAVAGSRHSH
jgi:aryl-phospho-beta-D-glucosidase BglC (GH1 family)